MCPKCALFYYLIFPPDLFTWTVIKSPEFTAQFGLIFFYYIANTLYKPYFILLRSCNFMYTYFETTAEAL